MLALRRKGIADAAAPGCRYGACAGSFSPHVSEIMRVRGAFAVASGINVSYTLRCFKGKNLIRENRVFTMRTNRIRTNVSDHLNLICMACGRIEDL
jgi:hypothetical protein